MTSTTDTAEHPEVTEISDLAEGLLPPSRSSDIRRHLDGCVLCADVYSSLEEIRGMLGTLPDAPRMPEDVAARIDAALAAEALLDVVAYENEEPDESAESYGSDEGSGRETASVSRETSTARSAPAPRPADRPSGHAPSATGPGRRARVTRRRTGAAIGAVLTAAVIGTGVLLVQGGGGTSNVGRTPASASTSASSFAKANLESKVTELLHQGDVASLGTEGVTPKSSPKNPEIPKAAMAPPACVQRGTHRDDDPLGFKQGTYEGKAVYLLVLPHTSDPTHRVTAFIVDASCTAKDPSTAGELLYTHSYKRG
ncbi:hypothetical protein ABII15_19260 [Streptomyces sp. HUAS MG91]|uniref:Zinc-finger domain-containing protein n=1 Tax=Streptomyces tabacisoli TaxID=3156398 RepID=A0AAU8IV98_9ACTN